MAKYISSPTPIANKTPTSHQPQKNEGSFLLMASGIGTVWAKVLMDAMLSNSKPGIFFVQKVYWLSKNIGPLLKIDMQL